MLVLQHASSGFAKKKNDNQNTHTQFAGFKKTHSSCVFKNVIEDVGKSSISKKHYLSRELFCHCMYLLNKFQITSDHFHHSFKS